jgi:hypothetical protein
MNNIKKNLLSAVALALVMGVMPLAAHAQLAPSGFEGSPARDAGDAGVLQQDFRQVRSQDRQQYREGLNDLIAADRIEKEQAAAAEAQARQDAIQQQVQDTLAQPSDYGTRLEALKSPPPTTTTPPTPVIEPEPVIEAPEPGTRPVRPTSPRNPGGIAPALQ